MECHFQLCGLFWIGFQVLVEISGIVITPVYDLDFHYFTEF